MANKIVAIAFSIGAMLIGGITWAGCTVLRWNSRKQLKEKQKDEESVIEHLTYKDVAIQFEETYEQHEPSKAHSTSFADVATQTEVQQYPMESVRGLQNLGNTCYFDSTMQALVHTNLVFREKLENLGKKDEFVRNVLKFLSAMQLKTSKPYSPNDLHRMFGKKSPKFADYRQHDSHECLRNFLDNVRKEERDNSGAVDKRKVLTVVDSVFGGHFITVYICEECETPYHVCEALLDISLPIMIDEKDLAAMNSARHSNQKNARTVKLQTPKTQIKHHASQTDDSNKRNVAKSPKDKSITGEDSIESKPNKIEQDSILDVILQENTSDQVFQLKSKTVITDRHSTNIYAEPLASDHVSDVSFTSNEPKARSVQGKVTHEAEELQDVVNLSPKNVDLENTSGGKIEDILKENSLPIQILFDPDTESKTFSLDDNDETVENSKTSFGTETDLEGVCKAKESDTSDEDNKKAKISNEEKESRNESGSETVVENVESSCSSTKAESNLAEKNDVANDPGLSQGYSHEPSISVETEDNKEREASKWAKSDARYNQTEIQECIEEQEQSSEEDKQREEHQHNGKNSLQMELVQERRNTEEKEGEQHSYNAEPLPQIHDINEIESGQNSENAEQDQDHHGIQEKYGQHFPNNSQLDEKQSKELEQHDGKHLLNAQPEEQQNDAKEQQNGQHDRNTKASELREENKDEQEVYQHRVKDQEPQQELEDEVGREHEKVLGQEKNEQEQDLEETLKTYDDENYGKKGEDDKETDEEADEEADEDKDSEEEGKEEVDDDQQKLKHYQELEEQHDGKKPDKQELNVEQAQQKHSDENDDKIDEDEKETDGKVNEEKGEEEDDDDDEQDNFKLDQELQKQRGGKHLLNFEPEKQHKGAAEQQSEQYIRNEEIKEEVGEEQREPEVEEQRRQDEEVEQEDEEQQQEVKQEEVQVQEHEVEAPRKEANKDGYNESEHEDEKDEDGQEEVVEEEAEVEFEDRKVVKEEIKDKDEDDDKEVEEEEEETEEDDEDQIEQEKQEIGETEFEVDEYASETRDRYRETVDKLMTPLSLSSPYLSSNETTIRKHVTIYDCLQYFTRKEHINKEYLCNDCYSKHLENGGTDVLLTSATKQTMIFNPPAILTLHLKRFELKPGGSVKRTDMITYGELLDISPYCSSMCLRNDPPCQNIWYSLYGVVVHHGSTLKSGHYIAYVKIKDNDAVFKKFLQEKYFDRDLTREQLIEMMQMKQPGETPKQPDGTWYCMNDSWSHKVQVSEVLNQEAYLLFYERMS